MMTTFKWMALGTVLGFSVAMGVSCGPSKCTPSSCAFGCCDATGACQMGSSDSQCGMSGAACSACVLGQNCRLGICVLGGTGGNGGGGSGGGGTGGGTGGGGGGGGTSDALCTRMSNASMSFFASRTVCTDGTQSESPQPNALAQCNAGIAQCAGGNDRSTIATYAGCMETARVCTPGNEGGALTDYNGCVNGLASGLSTACATALFSSSTGGGGGTPVGGGSGGGTPVGGGSGGGTPVGGGTGGGTPVGGGTGGGAGSCSSYGTRYMALMAGRSTCPYMGFQLNAAPGLASTCSSACNTTDQLAIANFTTCLGDVPNCTSGNESLTVGGFQSCGNNTIATVSLACQSALTTFGPSGTGGGGGTPVGGGTGGGTPTGGGTGCTTLSGFNFRNQANYGAADGGFEITSGAAFNTAADPSDILGTEVVWAIGGIPTNVTIGTRNLANEGTYDTCRFCVTLDRTCTTSCSGGFYLGRTGMMTVSSAPRTPSGNFSASISNVEFREWSRQTDTAIPNGRCFIVPSASINAPVQ